MLVQALKKTLKKSLVTLSWDNVDFEVWTSQDASISHCYSNIVMIVASRFRLDHKIVFKKLKLLLKQQETGIQNIFLANNFLHVVFVDAYFAKVLNVVLNWDKSNPLHQQKPELVNYEWVSANPTGFLHLGHARNIFVGQAIVNLLQFSGHHVTKEFYINDSGNQIFQLGKSVFYQYQKLLGKQPEEFEQMYRNPEIVLVAQALVDQFGKKYLDVDFVQDGDVQSFFVNFSKTFFLEQMKTDLHSWGVNFDQWFSETSLLSETSLTTFWQKLKKQNLSYQKDNALWMRLDENSDEQDFVLLKKNRETTYFVGDILYHINKFERGYDKIIDIFGADHHHHYLKLRTVLKRLGYDVQRFSVDLLQMVKIVRDGQTIKMSKRKGTNVYLRDLITLTGTNFLKFMLMFRQKTTKFSFDLNLAKRKDATNPFFYTQYAYARSCQLINKASYQFTSTLQEYRHLTTTSEQNLLLCLHNFAAMLQRATTKREPQLLVQYLLTVSKSFHVFYEKVPVLQSSPQVRNERLALVFAISWVIKKVSQLLGVQLQTRM